MGDTEDITIKDLYNLIQGVVQSNEEIKEQNKIIREEIKTEFQSVKSDVYKELKTIEEENNKLKEENERLKARVSTLEVRASAIERRQKKYNLMIYGLIEEEEEKVDFQSLLEIFTKRLEVSCTFHDFRDIHRIGNKDANKVRPIAVEVVNYQLKLELLKNSKKLKGTRLYISQDYILEDYEKQKILYKYLKEAKANNIPAKIKNNILIVNGKNFTAEELTAQNNEDNEEHETFLNKDQETEITTEDATEVIPDLPKQKTLVQTQTETTGNAKNKGKQIQAAPNEIPLKRSNRLKNIGA